jgi:uncharacterized membrane protein YkoI
MKKTFLISGLLLSLLIAGCKSEQHKNTHLEAQAKVSKVDAEKIALSQTPNGTVKEAELEKEHGKLIWSFDIATPNSKEITEVAVDAMDGKVISVEKETPEHEKKEKDSTEKN